MLLNSYLSLLTTWVSDTYYDSTHNGLLQVVLQKASHAWLLIMIKPEGECSVRRTKYKYSANGRGHVPLCMKTQVENWFKDSRGSLYCHSSSNDPAAPGSLRRWGDHGQAGGEGKAVLYLTVLRMQNCATGWEKVELYTELCRDLLWISELYCGDTELHT